MPVEETSNEESRLYDVLGLKSDASHSQIRRAYHVAALKLHPDKVKAKGVLQISILVLIVSFLLDYSLGVRCLWMLALVAPLYALWAVWGVAHAAPRWIALAVVVVNILFYFLLPTTSLFLIAIFVFNVSITCAMSVLVDDAALVPVFALLCVFEVANRGWRQNHAAMDLYKGVPGTWWSPFMSNAILCGILILILLREGRFGVFSAKRRDRWPQRLGTTFFTFAVMFVLALMPVRLESFICLPGNDVTRIFWTSLYAFVALLVASYAMDAFALLVFVTALYEVCVAFATGVTTLRRETRESLEKNPSTFFRDGLPLTRALRGAFVYACVMYWLAYWRADVSPDSGVGFWLLFRVSLAFGGAYHQIHTIDMLLNVDNIFQLLFSVNVIRKAQKRILLRTATVLSATNDGGDGNAADSVLEERLTEVKELFEKFCTDESRLEDIVVARMRRKVYELMADSHLDSLSLDEFVDMLTDAESTRRFCAFVKETECSDGLKKCFARIGDEDEEEAEEVD